MLRSGRNLSLVLRDLQLKPDSPYTGRLWSSDTGGKHSHSNNKANVIMGGGRDGGMAFKW